MTSLSPPTLTLERSEPDILVASWNVLHIIHELNYARESSPVIEQYRIVEEYAQEQKRLADIVLVLQQILADHIGMECFLCLQEVPGDLIPLLEQVLDSVTKSSSNGRAVLYKQMYPRHPRLRQGRNESIYKDSSEFLVTIYYKPEGRSSTPLPQMFWIPCPVDGGKGALGLTAANGLSVWNMHVPYNYNGARALLSVLPWPNGDQQSIMVGDMNQSSSSLKKLIQTITRAPMHVVASEKATRVGVNANGVRETCLIDYFLVSPVLSGSIVPPVHVIDHIGDISDHFPILLKFTIKS